MFNTKNEAIASVTRNNRSRRANLAILDTLLLEDNLWLRLERPDGTQDIFLEKLSFNDGKWHAQLLHGIPLLQTRSVPSLFDAEVLCSQQLLRWVQVATNRARFDERLSAFRSALIPGQILQVNGYTFELVKPLRGGTGTASQGWIVQRDGTPMRLVGREFDLAIRKACH